MRYYQISSVSSKKLQKIAKGKKYADAETYKILVIYNLQVKDQGQNYSAVEGRGDHLQDHFEKSV